MPGVVHIVDDDASFATAMERRVKHAGYEVAIYASAQHLLDRLPSESVPGCILLDVRIPGLSGPELQERLSELGSTLPIIFLTGYPDISTTVRTSKRVRMTFSPSPSLRTTFFAQLNGRSRVTKPLAARRASWTSFALTSRH